MLVHAEKRVRVVAAQIVQPWRAEKRLSRCQSAADVVIVVVSEIVVSGLWYLEDRLVGTSWEVQVKWGGIADGHRGDGGKECSMITIWLDEERYLE
jgi:hypothetical protein